jgi:hypothetical protein
VLFTTTTTNTDVNGKDIVTNSSFHEYERTSDIFTRILTDKYSGYNSQNGKPLRDFVAINGERIVSAIGGDNYVKTTNSTDGVSGNGGIIGAENSSKYDIFTIPKELLPGEVDGDVTNSDTFEGSYIWKVSNYNLLYGRPEERPEFSATHTFLNDIVMLKVMVAASKEMTDAKITGIYFIDKMFDKFLIEKDNSNSNSEYFDNDNYLMGNDVVKETVFATDPSDYDISKGYCSGFSWTPLSKNRTRPVVINGSNEKLFWYIKENVYGNKIICMAKGKTFDRVGEYCTTVPSSNIALDEELDGAQDVFSHTIINVNGVYFMYYIVNYNGEYKVRIATSSDAMLWKHDDVRLPFNNVYSICSKVEDNKIELYCCVYENGSFNIYKTASQNGINFIGKENVFSSQNPISGIFILKYNGEDIIFYTEETIDNNEYVYSIKNNSNEVFPEIFNASNPFVIKDGMGYRLFFDRNGKICSVFMKNYIEKNIMKDDYDISRVVSGDLSFARSSDTGYINEYIINRSYIYGFNYYCSDEFRQADLNNIVGWVIKGENNAKYREYRIEGPFLTIDNVSSVNGSMEPYPFKYMEIVKDLY